MNNPFSRPAHAGGTPRSGSLQIGPGRDYIAGYADPDLESLAEEDGAAALQNPDVWGDNTHDHTLDIPIEGHGVAGSLIAHTFREEVQGVAEEVENALPRHRTLKNLAIRGINLWREAQTGVVTLRHEILDSGLPIPTRKAYWQMMGLLTVLFAGDWALIAVAFQILGLSDKPWIPGFAMTDDLHLAALAAVVLLVVLAHGAGDRLRSISITLEKRRLETDEEARATLPRVSVFDIALASVGVAFATLALVGVGMVRLDYLALQGIPAQSFPFLAIQIGVLAAAVFIAYAFANPFARQWWTQLKTASAADDSMKSELAALDAMTGEINGKVDLLGALPSLAGHHVNADRSNVNRQLPLIVRKTILAQPEPISIRMFPETLRRLAAHSDEELLDLITGITPLPSFEKVGDLSVKNRLTRAIGEVRQLTERFERVRLDELLGDKGLPPELEDVDDTEELLGEPGVSEADARDAEESDAASPAQPVHLDYSGAEAA